MAKAKITFEYNNKTGRRDIHIEYTSDPDALAHEHEKEHARIVKELLGKGLITKDEARDVVIDRPAGNKKNKVTGKIPAASRTPKASRQ